jgi:hypothetical protein
MVGGIGIEGGGLVCIARSGGDVAGPSIRRSVSFPPSLVVFRCSIGGRLFPY